jgi:hypothetical protein
MRRRLTFALLFSATALYGACDNAQMVPAPVLPLSEDGLVGKQESPAKAALALDAAFEAQAQAFGVPSALLKAIGYSATRWYMVPGTTSEFDSEAPAFGVMALRGERLERGAQLAKRTVAEVQQSPEANIAAAAALLRAEADAQGLDEAARADLAAWVPVVASYSGLISEEARLLYVHTEVYKTLASGVAAEEQVAKGVRLSAQPAAEPFAVSSASTMLKSPLPSASLVGYSGAKWLPAPSSNYTDGRSKAITLLVLHTCSGQYSGCLSWLRTPYPTNPNKTSAHYVVNESGSEVAQIVDEADTAHHVGAQWMGASTNAPSVGIEHGGFSYQGTNKWTEGQIAASAKLSCDIVKRNRIIRDRNHIIGHYQPDPVRRAEDPGTGFPWADYMNRLNTCVGGGTGSSAVIVDSNQANNDSNGKVDLGSSAWVSSTNVSGFYGSGYYAAPTASVSDAMTFEFNLPAGGTKELFAWWTSGSDRSPTTPFVVFNAAGTSLGTVNKDQRVNGGKWVSLGRFAFTAGWNSVAISRWTTAGAQVIADAIKVE